MKTLLLGALLITSFFLTGCDTLLVDRGPAYRRPVVYQDGYYADNRRYDDRRYDGRRDSRDVQIVRSNDGGYYRPTPVVRQKVVVRKRPSYNRTRKKVVVRKNNNDRREDRRDRREDRRNNDND